MAGERPPSVALVSGFWGQNIGNAFFNLGGMYILQQVFGEDAVAFIQDQPGYRTFHNQTKGNPRNDLGLLKYLDVEYIVLQGPLLTRTVSKLWDETLRFLRSRGTRLILLSAGLFKYDAEEIEVARSFVRTWKPEIVVTRDARTFEALESCCERIYNGIDSAFFVPKVYRPVKLHLGPYVAMCFDRRAEPTITVVGRREAATDRADCVIEVGEEMWSLRFSRVTEFFAKLGKWQAYIGHFLDRRKLPTRMGAYTIVRPEHRFNPHIAWKIYKHPNGIASDEPFTYLTVYANAELVLSDRVHACVVALAYGRPAMLFSRSPRSALFDRLGLQEIRKRPVTLDQDYLERERKVEIEFLREAVRSCG